MLQLCAFWGALLAKIWWRGALKHFNWLGSKIPTLPGDQETLTHVYMYTGTPSLCDLCMYLGHNLLCLLIRYWLNKLKFRGLHVFCSETTGFCLTWPEKNDFFLSYNSLLDQILQRRDYQLNIKEQILGRGWGGLPLPSHCSDLGFPKIEM